MPRGIRVSTRTTVLKPAHALPTLARLEFDGWIGAIPAAERFRQRNLLTERLTVEREQGNLFRDHGLTRVECRQAAAESTLIVCFDAVPYERNRFDSLLLQRGLRIDGLQTVLDSLCKKVRPDPGTKIRCLSAAAV